MIIVSFGLTLLTLGCVALLTAWFSDALTRIGLAAERRRRAGALLAGIAAWLLFTAFLARSGSLAVWESRPPRLPFVPLTAFAALIFVNRTPFFGKLLRVTPRHWPVAMQSFRIFVELAFWGLYRLGGAPALVTFEGRNFDVLVGVTAPLVAFLIWKRIVGPRFVIAWNAFGILVLGNTIFTTLTALPGPMHLARNGEIFTAFAEWPFVWIPALLAPLALFLHIFSIRQNSIVPPLEQSNPIVPSIGTG